MKQGHILNRIVTFVLFGGVVIYLVASAWQGLAGQMTTVISYAYTLDDVAEATGFLVREETVLPQRSPLADVLPAEGEKVAVGQAVAYLYSDAAALGRRQELRKLEMQLEQLTYLPLGGGDLSDNAKLTEEIMAELVTLRSDVADRDLTALEESTLRLKSMVYKRDYAYGSGGDSAALSAEVAALQERRSALIAAAGEDTAVVRADQSGVFSGVVDGYEDVLTPDGLAQLTPSRLSALAAHPPVPPADAVGKLITDTRWYFVCTVSEEQSRRLTEGWQVKIRFSRDWSGEVSMRAERIGQAENGRVPVVFSSTHFLSPTTLLRHQTVDIVYSSVSGIRVPKNALAQDVEGQWGVFAVVSAQAEFKPVTIVGDDEDYYLVQPLVPATDGQGKAAKKALRAGDEIILQADGLVDGKVVR